jgi:serine O-acetyltransferase
MRTLIARASEDLAVIVSRDPSIHSRAGALLHPALPALWGHRVAHALHRRGHRLLARLVAYLARALTGLEIHPGARLGRRVFIDHGAAVVIGETAQVGDDVTIFHQVTLGAVGWWRDAQRAEGERRHPCIGNGVVIGANATVLGPITVGDDALIGAATLVLADVPAGARVLAAPSTVVPRRAPVEAREPADALRELASAGCW